MEEFCEWTLVKHNHNMYLYHSRMSHICLCCLSVYIVNLFEFLLDRNYLTDWIELICFVQKICFLWRLELKMGYFLPFTQLKIGSFTFLSETIKPIVIIYCINDPLVFYKSCVFLWWSEIQDVEIVKICLVSDPVWNLFKRLLIWNFKANWNDLLCEWIIQPSDTRLRHPNL